MKRDDVTLIIPCYNVADTLVETLAAVDALDPAPARVICLDDGSTDGTRAIIESHPGVELVVHEENMGLGGTLNDGLERTETAWLAKIDADVVVEPDWLGTLYDHCTDRSADLVQGAFSEQITTLADLWRDRYPSPPFPQEVVRNKAVNGSNILCRVEALRSVGGWDARHRRAFDDIDLFERLIEAGYTVDVTPAVDSLHIRTDTWREVLHTSWAYSHDYRKGRYKPTTVRAALRRLPERAKYSAWTVKRDLLNGYYKTAWIGALLFFYTVWWDAEHAIRYREEQRETDALAVTAGDGGEGTVGGSPVTEKPREATVAEEKSPETTVAEKKSPERATTTNKG